MADDISTICSEFTVPVDALTLYLGGMSDNNTRIRKSAICTFAIPVTNLERNMKQKTICTLSFKLPHQNSPRNIDQWIEVFYIFLCS